MVLVVGSDMIKIALLGCGPTFKQRALAASIQNPVAKLFNSSGFILKLMPIPLFSSAQVRVLDVQSAKAQQISSFELMQRAGRASANFALQHWPLAERFMLLCGPGNNGGDGYVCARYLQQAGRSVQLYADAVPNSKSPDAAQNALLWSQMGATLTLQQFIDGPVCCPDDVIIDALFGIGLSKPLDPEFATAIVHANAQRCGKFALDVPSGLNADTGAAQGNAAFRADYTLSFIVHKTGLHTGSARAHVGICRLDSLSLPAELLASAKPAAQLLIQNDLRLPSRMADSHKGKNGHVLVLGGELGMGGAVLLAAEAALYAGAGWVSVATRLEHISALMARCPEAMGFDASDTAQLNQRADRASVLVLGPGLGQRPDFAELLLALVQQDKPKVLDADALNWLAERSKSAENSQIDEQTVLTPHPGEAARMLACSVAEVEADRFAALAALVKKFRCMVVLKGAGTLVGAPEQLPVVCGLGNAGMAVAGMGDVLSGCIGALLAQASNLQLSCFEACVQAVLAHSHAADQLALEAGTRGLRASELGPEIRKALNTPSGAGAQNGARR